MNQNNTAFRRQRGSGNSRNVDWGNEKNVRGYIVKKDNRFLPWTVSIYFLCYLF